MLIGLVQKLMSPWGENKLKLLISPLSDILISFWVFLQEILNYANIFIISIAVMFMLKQVKGDSVLLFYITILTSWKIFTVREFH